MVEPVPTPEAAAPKPPDRSRRAAVIATVGIVVILGLAVFCVAVVAPLREVHNESTLYTTVPRLATSLTRVRQSSGSAGLGVPRSGSGRTCDCQGG